MDISDITRISAKAAFNDLMNNLTTVDSQKVIDALRAETIAQNALNEGEQVLDLLKSQETSVLGGNPILSTLGKSGAVFDIVTLGTAIYEDNRGAFLKGLADIGVAGVTADLTGMFLENLAMPYITKGLILTGLEGAGLILAGEIAGAALLVVACYQAAKITSPGTAAETEALWNQIGEYFSTSTAFLGENLSKLIYDLNHQSESLISSVNNETLSLLKSLDKNVFDFLIPPTYADGVIETVKQQVTSAKSTSSPIILDLNNNGVETIGVKAGAYFDHAGDGFAEQSGWVGANDGLLVRDLNSIIYNKAYLRQYAT